MIKIPYQGIHPNDIEITPMSLSQYHLEIDSLFQKRLVDPPSRVCPTFFNEEDATPTELTSDITDRLVDIWSQLTDQSLLGAYVIQTHATGEFWEGSDFDVGLVTHIEYFEARQLERKINNKMLGKGTPAYDKAKELFEAGKRDFVHSHILIAQPYGIIFDLLEKRWITFDKTERHHAQFLDQVLGLNPEVFY